jgi:hypothetical protein
MDIENIVHAGRILAEGGLVKYLYLKKLAPQSYAWFDAEEAVLTASSIEEALKLARRRWKNDGFRTLNCGFRYTLPERDEHGMNALFHQMAASYSSMNGIYFDDELGGNCIVQLASQEARSVWDRLKNEKVG